MQAFDPRAKSTTSKTPIYSRPLGYLMIVACSAWPACFNPLSIYPTEHCNLMHVANAAVSWQIDNFCCRLHWVVKGIYKHTHCCWFWRSAKRQERQTWNVLSIEHLHSTKIIKPHGQVILSLIQRRTAYGRQWNGKLCSHTLTIDVGNSRHMLTDIETIWVVDSRWFAVILHFHCLLKVFDIICDYITLDAHFTWWTMRQPKACAEQYGMTRQFLDMVDKILQYSFWSICIHYR